ncbi:hypothetical protein SAMN04487936_107202 [Halobacillus dabanensis]|uniref:Helix-turn-helix domain-containing protein n=1 Tax=Halobacillus dabanensis TaxID=240302 RepID=A0A1I3WXM4_HALDA|nr:hypothetical protein [Halobacillus dabanensis]SFK12238.1 hypothetical protein SAMN04487936_107202 [Halobacillus dabanensis]
MIQQMVKDEKVLPHDKKQLMEAKGYELYNRELVRKVFPRIIAEVRDIRPKSKTGDIIPFYFALLSYIDGNRYRADGSLNGRFGYAFPSQDRIAEMTGVDRKRHKQLTRILKANGILSDVRDYYEGTNRYLWYKPSFCPQISDDGYIVNEDGEKVVPDYSEIIK